MRTPELLAPAGGWEQLQYAIRFGADAVYLATDRFGMRQRAENFPLDEVPRAVAYAHKYGVRVHVTCNTLMHEADFETLPGYLRALKEAGADAVLVSDLGALEQAREVAPQLEIHVSTQASVSNARAALSWYRLGAKRIVCAREMSLEAIRRMREQLPRELELECFVHGSMCMAVSGRCLISDFMTGRSATNGHCSQPCRWNYSLVEENRPGQYFPIEQDENGSYIMNAHDLNMLAHLDDLVRAGVDSVKIEGRNKKAFYVATVVNAYRQVLDGADPALLAGELEAVSHRPYDTGFYYGPAHQAVSSDAYLRYYDWAADVLSCRVLEAQAAARAAGAADAAQAAGAPLFEAEVLCRNRFEEGDELEVLSPRSPVRRFTVSRIRLVVPPDPDLPGIEFPERPVCIANRAMDRYRIHAPFELREHDILRIARPGRTTERRDRL